MRTTDRYILWALIATLALAGACRSQAAPEPAAQADEHDHAEEPAGAVTLSAAAVKAADIRTEPAAGRAVARRITAPGELEWNPRRVAHVTARAAGRLERVLAVRGDRVAAGALLAEIYSPGFLTLQAEYLQAARRLARAAGQAADEDAARAVLAGARERLTVLGLTGPEIDGLGAAAAPLPLLPVRAPLGGTVLESGAVPGDAVEPGASLFRLADPSTLWACLHIRENDLGAVRTGSEVVLRVQAYPGEEFPGRLALVGDEVDPDTRTVEGRVEIANPGRRLKAGMYVEGAAAAGERRALVVPETAVQDDEGRAIVFVRTGERTFARRAVKVGERFGGLVEVVEGLAAGEEVVTSGAFLLKSELGKASLEDEHGHH
jgi:RND family efflux transporter MFP subunit